MSIFYEKFTELCKQRKTFPNVVAKKLGISSGTVTGWKNGSIPRSSAIAKIAAYFDVTIDYMWGRENAPAADGEDAKAAEFYALLEELTPEQREIIFSNIELMRKQNKQREG